MRVHLSQEQLGMYISDNTVANSEIWHCLLDHPQIFLVRLVHGHYSYSLGCRNLLFQEASWTRRIFLAGCCLLCSSTDRHQPQSARGRDQSIHLHNSLSLSFL